MNLEDQYDRIFKYLYFRLHDRHIAEDLTQEAFLRFRRSDTGSLPSLSVKQDIPG